MMTKSQAPMRQHLRGEGEADSEGTEEVDGASHEEGHHMSHKHQRIRKEMSSRF